MTRAPSFGTEASQGRLSRPAQQPHADINDTLVCDRIWVGKATAQPRCRTTMVTRGPDRTTSALRSAGPEEALRLSEGEGGGWPRRPEATEERGGNPKGTWREGEPGAWGRVCSVSGTRRWTGSEQGHQRHFLERNTPGGQAGFGASAVIRRPRACLASCWG